MYLIKQVLYIARISKDVELVLRFENFCIVCMYSLFLERPFSVFSLHVPLPSVRRLPPVLSPFVFLRSLRLISFPTSISISPDPGSYIRQLTRDLLRNSLANEIKFLLRRSSRSARVFA